MGKFLDLKNVWHKVKKNLNWSFVILLIALLVAEAFVIKSSVAVVLSSGRSQEKVGSDSKVRINFTAYKQATDRINSSASFTPSSILTVDPFGTAAAPH